MLEWWTEQIVSMRLGELSAQHWVFLAVNAVIVATYGFIAIRVAPLFPVRLPTLVGAFGFFAFCALTHLDQIIHTLYSRETQWGAIASEDHMLLIHAPQAGFVVLFAAGFLRDLQYLRRTGHSAEELDPLDSREY